jgi:hypothetical protein
MANAGHFTPHRSLDQDARVRHVEMFLERLGADVVNLAQPRAAARNTGGAALVVSAGGGSGGGGGGGGAGTLAGDVVGPPAATVIEALQSFALLLTAPAMGDVLTWNGSAWVNTQVTQPDTFKQATATAAGSTAVWTPAAGKKFRLLRYMIEVTADAALAAPGVLTVALLDAAAGIAQSHALFVPGAAGTVVGDGLVTPWIDLGATGILSAAINQVLNVNLSAALTSGRVNVLTAGVEE